MNLRQSTLNLYFSGCLNELTIRQMFVFLKENLILESLLSEIFEKNILNEKDINEYIDEAPGRYYIIEKILKCLIKKKRCKEFVACMRSSSSHRFVYDSIWRFQKYKSETALNGE